MASIPTKTRICPLFKHGLCLLNEDCLLSHEFPPPSAPENPENSENPESPPRKQPTEQKISFPSPPKHWLCGGDIRLQSSGDQNGEETRGSNQMKGKNLDHLLNEIDALSSNKMVLKGEEGGGGGGDQGNKFELDNLLHEIDSLSNDFQPTRDENRSLAKDVRFTGARPKNNNLKQLGAIPKYSHPGLYESEVNNNNNRIYFTNPLEPSEKKTFGRGSARRGEILRRPGPNHGPSHGPNQGPNQVSRKRICFCHQCKKEIELVRPGLTCPFCMGTFVEESDEVRDDVSLSNGIPIVAATLKSKLDCNKLYFCHQCETDITSIEEDGTCPQCSGDFIEESYSVERLVTNNNIPSVAATLKPKLDSNQLYFCHQCKMVIPSIKDDGTCQQCGGDFIEERYSVERLETNNNNSNVDQQEEEEEERPVQSTNGNEIVGFAWVPPQHLMQSFLPQDQKLSGFETPNPYLYLDDEDVVEDNFPDLEEPLFSTPLVDERISKKVSTRSRTSSLMIVNNNDNCSSEVVGKSCSFAENDECNDYDGENVLGENSQKLQQNRGLEKRRLKREKRKLTIKQRKAQEMEKQSELEKRKEKREQLKEQERLKRMQIKMSQKESMEKEALRKKREIAFLLQNMF